MKPGNILLQAPLQSPGEELGAVSLKGEQQHGQEVIGGAAPRTAKLAPIHLFHPSECSKKHNCRATIREKKQTLSAGFSLFTRDISEASARDSLSASRLRFTGMPRIIPRMPSDALTQT